MPFGLAISPDTIPLPPEFGPHDKLESSPNGVIYFKRDGKAYAWNPQLDKWYPLAEVGKNNSLEKLLENLL